MFLKLRWHGIDEVGPYRVKSVNVLLSPDGVDRLEMVKLRHDVPYSQIIRRAIFYLKDYTWKRYKEWVEIETYDEPLPKYKGYTIREQLDKKVEEALRRPGFEPGIQFLEHGPEKRVRVCFRMTIGDIAFLSRISKGKATLSECVGHLIRKNVRIYRRKSGKRGLPWITGLIIRYKPHRKITFPVRQKDDEAMKDFIKRYALKYDEKLTKSEIVELAYHLFKRMGKGRQLKILEQEKKESRKRGKFKKISVSISFEGKYHWEEHIPVRKELRAALYSLLKSEKFSDLVDN